MVQSNAGVSMKAWIAQVNDASDVQGNVCDDTDFVLGKWKDDYEIWCKTSALSVSNSVWCVN